MIFMHRAGRCFGGWFCRSSGRESSQAQSWSSSPLLGAYVTPRILGGGRNMMISNLIELQFGQGRNWPLGAALSVLLLVIVAATLLLYVRATTRERVDG